MTDFFDQWGFFYVGKLEINDYARYEFNITQKMVDDTQAYIAEKNYPKPPMDITEMMDGLLGYQWNSLSLACTEA